jgi:hypothetical protein
MNPADILKSKLAELQIPQDAISSLDINSLLSNISNPDNLKNDLVTQLVSRLGMDSNMVESMISKFNFSDIAGLVSSKSEMLENLAGGVTNNDIVKNSSGVIASVTNFFKNIFK